jgi:cellulose synthase/poly-beta-1,6-N-acetylglucosamine synthase-like glycosyltransferase
LTVATAVFWGGAAVILYTYVGYPAGMWLAARFRPRPVRRRETTPTVSLVIAAYNEAGCIARKLQNCLALDYPADRLEIVMASDGSTDGTADIARRAAPAATVMAFPERRGKPCVLNDVIPRCRGEIVVLSDARQMYDATALRALVPNFGDPTVGAVSGELHLVNDHGRAVGEGVGLYWRYEKAIRRWESAVDSTVGATGAIYAIRRALFAPIPTDTLLDDVLIPLRISAQGYRVVFERDARAFDRVAATPRQEFTRKVRTIAGNLQLLAREGWAWNPWRNRLWFQLMSHKFLRLVMPFVLIGVLGATAALARRPFYATALIAQLLFYAAAMAGRLTEGRPVSRWFAAPYGFCLLNVAAVVSVLRFLTGTQSVTWRKALDDREQPPARAGEPNLETLR